jgi:hypothetical protein
VALQDATELDRVCCFELEEVDLILEADTNVLCCRDHRAPKADVIEHSLADDHGSNVRVQLGEHCYCWPTVGVG